MPPRSFPVVLALCLDFAMPGLAHEFWIEPQQYQVESGAPLAADLRNGEEFKGSALAYFPKRTARFELISEGASAPAGARMGDIPALAATAPGAGLLVILHQTEASTLKWTDWEKFLSFTKHKNFAGFPGRHMDRGLPQRGFTERYWRYAKALVAVGSGAGADRPSGMETEFVALGNPYTDAPENGLQVQLLYKGRPRTQAQIEVFDKAPDGSVEVSYLTTGDEGRATVPLTRGHRYLLDGVVLLPAEEDSGAVWETHWAALTFMVPG